MKTAAIVLYVIQAIAIVCAIVTGQEFIDFSSGPALFETIGFFFPAILGLIFERIAYNKEQKSAQSSAEGPNANSAAPTASSAPKPKAAVIDPSVQYCPKCGTRQDSENAFCVACGSKIGQ